MSRKRDSLLYTLRTGVEAKDRNGTLYLVSRIPLKTLVLHRSWKPALDLLDKNGSLTLEEAGAAVSQADLFKVKRFLDELVHKGYLSQGGVDPRSEWPSVTVIIPVRNRPKDISACLGSLERVEYPREKLEVIVVDDASTDETPGVVSRFPVRLISLKEHCQAPSCRNRAAAKAKGEILAFLDSDCAVDPLWLKELVPAFEHPEVGVVGGLVDSAMDNNGLDKYEKVKSSLRIASWFKRSKRSEHFFYVPSCNLLVRRELFLQLGGFRETLLVGEDVDLCWRAEDSGRLIDYRPQGRVLHRHRNKMKDFCSRRFDYGTSEPLLQQLHRRRTKRLMVLPSPSLFWALFFLAFAANSVILFGLSWLWGLAHGGVKFARIRKRRLPIGFASLLGSVLRNYWAFLYHCCAFVSRYYLFGAFLFLPFSPTLSFVITGAHVVAGATEFFVKRPRLNLPAFFFYFTAEQIAYQMGVWWGCLKRLYFSPVNPMLAFRLPGQ
jgi:mycofactocin glycosyltransferase